MVFAICCLAAWVGERPVKTLLAALVGLLLSTVGHRLGLGRLPLHLRRRAPVRRIQFIVVVIGLFSVSEMLVMLEQSHAGQTVIKATAGRCST